eukprot:gene27787-17121_t
MSPLVYLGPGGDRGVAIGAGATAGGGCPHFGSEEGARSTSDDRQSSSRHSGAAVGVPGALPSRPLMPLPRLSILNMTPEKQQPHSPAGETAACFVHGTQQTAFPGAAKPHSNGEQQRNSMGSTAAIPWGATRIPLGAQPAFPRGSKTTAAFPWGSQKPHP